MRIFFIGDVVGKPGRRAVQMLLSGIRSEHGIDLVLANAENSAGGMGVTPETAQELLEAGVNVLTSGNHIWAQKEIVPFLDSGYPLIRPLNFPAGVPGKGYWQDPKFTVINLMGRTFMGLLDCPFRAADRVLEELGRKSKVIIIDFHAEATSEKMALGRYLDGRVSAVLGTHTHVATVDACILPKGTAYITDVGMTGPIDSVIGNDVQSVVNRFLYSLPHRLLVAKGTAAVNGVIVDVDESSGKATSITRISRQTDKDDEV